MREVPLASAPWVFRDATHPSPWREARVPGCVHLDLRRLALIPDPFWGCNELELQWIEERAWEYQAAFSIEGDLLDHEHIDLVADGLDTVAAIVVNDHEVARTENMFIGHRWDIRDRLRPGRNEIRIRFESALDYIRSHRVDHRPRELNDPVGRCTVIRKQQCQFGWDWGPRFVTAGIWRDIRIEAWTGNRLESVRVTQEHRTDGSVILHLTPELARGDPGAACTWRLKLGALTVVEGTGPTVLVEHPQLWWPNGHGSQPLYVLEVSVAGADGVPIGEWVHRIGLRTIELERKSDDWGESFLFRINGRAIFAKGANWIPAHSFVAGLSRTDYERDLHSAAEAHMNMIRVWGGGIYESEHFYDVCDELGLLVWQDFMFACTLYPGDAAFVASVRDEAVHQVQRLRHRACLALWCGNNEVWGCNADELESADGAGHRAAYEEVFHRLLPEVVASHDGVTAYWPTSPWRSGPGVRHADGEARGDTHFWDVWHARKPVKDYEKYAFRFVSEFGMQSFGSPATLATFCPPDDANVFGPVMKNHQKNRDGNQTILDYVSRRFRFPKDQDALIYLSQLNQAECMQIGVEHWRRNMPRCMGALYWQLNDCWPVASWSSIEFTGRWKAAHFFACRFFAPTIASAHVPGDETSTIGNYRTSTVREIHLFTVSDAPQAVRGTLVWELRHLGGRRLQRGSKRVFIRPGESACHRTLDLDRPIARHGRDSLFLRVALDLEESVNGNVCTRRASEETVFLAPPRFLALPKGRASATVNMRSPLEATITFAAPVFLHRFVFDLEGLAHHASDNYFELYPGEKRAVEVRFAQPQTAQGVKKALTHHSLVDTY